MDASHLLSNNLGAAITREASKQTYCTIRLLVDRGRILQAYQAYAYFRWVDDCLDRELESHAERLKFVGRQSRLLASLIAHQDPGSLEPEEMMLAELVASDPIRDSGLRSYLRHMMAVMAFDSQRRGRLTSQDELDEYTRHLAVAVMDALHYFIGHGQQAPNDSTRYAAASAAHMAHMLRDTLEDVEAGYFNIPREVLKAAGIGPNEVEHPAYRAWVRERVLFAQEQFRIGREYLRRVESLRSRLAGHLYISRFQSVLSLIQLDEYLLRPRYPARKTLRGLTAFSASLLSSLFGNPASHPAPVGVHTAGQRKDL